MKKIYALCEARHQMPTDCECAIFPNTLNPTDLNRMMDIASEKLANVTELSLYVTGLTNVTELSLYVTGLTVALVTVINYCLAHSIELTLLHFDRDSGNYYHQKVGC